MRSSTARSSGHRFRRGEMRARNPCSCPGQPLEVHVVADVRLGDRLRGLLGDPRTPERDVRSLACLARKRRDARAARRIQRWRWLPVPHRSSLLGRGRVSSTAADAAVRDSMCCAIARRTTAPTERSSARARSFNAASRSSGMTAEIFVMVPPIGDLSVAVGRSGRHVIGCPFPWRT